MKQILIPLVAGLVIACTQSPAQKLEFKEHISKEIKLQKTASGTTFAVHNINGFIKVKGYNGDKVLIEIDKTITADSKESLEEGKQDFKLNFEEKQDSIIVYTSEPYESRPNRNHRDSNRKKEIKYNFNLEYTIKVPFDIALRASTINGGDILVEDVAGLLNVSNINGAIKLVNAKGASDVHTINGNVDANYVAIPAGQSAFKTLNGNITISYPESFSADCQFKSFNGEFFTDFPNAETLPVKVIKNKENENSKTVYKLNTETAIRIGNGGKVFKFETFNGNIYLKKQS